MPSKNYELEEFDNLLNGSLESELKNPSNKHYYLEILREKYPTFSIITACDYKQKGKAINLIKRLDFPDFLLKEYHNQNVQQALFSTHESINAMVDNLMQDFEFSVGEILSVDFNVRNSSKKIIIHRKGDWNCFSITQLKYFYYFDFLNKTSSEICKKVKRTIHDLDDNNKILIYLDKLIHELNIMTYDILNSYNLDSRNINFPILEKYDQTDFYMMVYKYLEKIQTFIEKHFLKYISDDLEIALTSKLLHEASLNQKIDLICKYLVNSSIDRQLMDIIYSNIIKLKERSKDEKLTYRRFKYMTLFISELHNLIVENAFEGKEDSTLLRFLCEINFNTKKFLQFLENGLDYKLKMFDSEKDKKSLIYTELKKISQLNNFTKNQYCNNTISVIEFVKNWLDQELKLMNQLEPLQYQIDFPPDDKSPKTQKLVLTLSVRELGVLVNYAYSLGVFKTKNKTEIFSFFSSYFGTLGSSSISLKSLQNAFYQNEEFTEENAKELFKKLLKNR